MWRQLSSCNIKFKVFGWAVKRNRVGKYFLAARKPFCEQNIKGELFLANVFCKKEYGLKLFTNIIFLGLLKWKWGNHDLADFLLETREQVSQALN